MAIIYKHLILCVPLPKRLEHRDRVFNEYVWENEKQHMDINENMVKKIKNIIKGWFKRIFNFDSELSRKRLEICDKCPHKTKILGDAYCSICWCALKSKSMVEDETCYDGR